MRKKANSQWLAVLGLLWSLTAFAQEPSRLKSIELEWEPVEKASGYEVRLSPKAGGKPLKFFTEEAKLIQDVPVGSYKLQIRSRTEDADIFSPWSDTVPVEIVEKEIIPLRPGDGAVMEAVDASKFPVDFEWQPVDQVKEYTLKVWNEKRRETPWVFVTKSTKKRLDVPPGEIYYWQVLFESATGISYAQAPTTFRFTVMGAKLTTPPIGPQTMNPDMQILQWEASPGAKSYKVKLHYRHLDETEYKVVDETTTENTQWTFNRLNRGAYKLEVIATAPRRTASDPGNFEFIVKPSDDELKRALADLKP